jgi:hypothetical protein
VLARNTHRGDELSERRNRPFGVTVIATIQIASAIGWAAITYLDQPDYGNVLGSLGYYEVAGPLLGLAGLLISYGMFTLKRQAWVLTMLWAGLNLFAALYSWYFGEPGYVAMVLGVITVYYLNQREVQAAFHVPLSRGWQRDAD